jgi:aryl-alcohol dehydrogenase-like predicted oxidoreductase
MDYALESEINFFDTAEMYSFQHDKDTLRKHRKIIGTWFKKIRKEK